MAGVACACLAAGACSSSSLDSNPFASASSLFKPDIATTTGRGKASTIVTAEDLVGADGSCASGAVVPAPAAVPEVQPEAAAPADGTVGQSSRSAAVAPIPENDPLLRPALGLALGMSECDVVRRAGAPERVDLGTDERGERSVTLAYMRGERAGIYRFREGRLFTIERVAVVEEPKKPAKPKAAAKPAQRQQAAKPAAAPKPKTAWPDAPKQQQQPAQSAPWPAPQGGQAPAQSQVWPSAPPLRSGQPSG
jgi:hypothetical protein